MHVCLCFASLSESLNSAFVCLCERLLHFSSLRSCRSSSVIFNSLQGNFVGNLVAILREFFLWTHKIKAQNFLGQISEPPKSLSCQIRSADVPAFGDTPFYYIAFCGTPLLILKLGGNFARPQRKLLLSSRIFSLMKILSGGVFHEHRGVPWEPRPAPVRR